MKLGPDIIYEGGQEGVVKIDTHDDTVTWTAGIFLDCATSDEHALAVIAFG